jgi:uncharacterized membrane protein
MKREERTVERHLRHWREKGLIDSTLEDRLRQSTHELARERSSSVLRTALAILGGSLLLAGLVLIVAENWQALPRVAKLGGWALLQAAFLFAAHELARRWGDRPFLAEGLALVAAGWVLGGIALVSQIYHIDSRPPNGIWLWLALILPMAWTLPRQACSVAVFISLLSALALEVGQGDSWIHAVTVDGPWVWLSLPLLAAALVSFLPHPFHGLRDWVGLWSLGATQVCLLVLGAAQDCDRSDIEAAWVPVGVGIALALALPGRVFPGTWDTTSARLFLVGSLAPWALLGQRYDHGHLPDLLAVGLAWVLQIAVSVLVIRLGAKAGASVWVNLGYLGLLAGVLTRYFDFFGNYLEGGLALALTGVLMLFVLFALEKARRRTLAREGAMA